MNFIGVTSVLLLTASSLLLGASFFYQRIEEMAPIEEMEMTHRELGRKLGTLLFQEYNRNEKLQKHTTSTIAAEAIFF
jgi:hypothetical protein